MNSRRVVTCVAALLAAPLAGCTREPMPKWAVTEPAQLCGDATLGPHDFCMPSSKIERWLKSGRYEILDAAISDSGTTAPWKLRLRTDDGTIISAKFKRAPTELDAFNNSPRREIAAYEIQKLFLDEDHYVVPPTVLACIPVDENKKRMPDLVAHPGADCAIGVLAYWIENISDKRVIDENDWKSDATYRENLGNLNALTVLIGHQDSIGDNFYRSKDKDRPRLFSVDNGLAFGAMGLNPIQWFSSTWSSVRVPILSQVTLDRLTHLDRAELERLGTVAELAKKDDGFINVEPGPPIDKSKGVRRTDDIVQMGLTTDEITDVNVRLVKMLGELEDKKPATPPAVSGR